MDEKLHGCLRAKFQEVCVYVRVFFVSLWVQLFSWLNLYLLWPLSLSCDQMAKGQNYLKLIKHNVMSVDAFLRDTLGWKQHCLLHKSNLIFFSLWIAFQRLEVCVTGDVCEWDEAQKADSVALTSFQPAAFWIDTGHKTANTPAYSQALCSPSFVGFLLKIFANQQI